MAGLISNITACSSMRGNVIPQKGPTMEEVYDSISSSIPNTPSNIDSRINIHVTDDTALHDALIDTQFKKIPNPELKMYVFPHVVGLEEIPIPGYTTEFKAYNHDHYVLPNETMRD